MNIMVTTPRSQMVAAAREAADCLAAGGGEYFRRFNPYFYPAVFSGERIYYVENGFIRGFCTIVRRQIVNTGRICATTGKAWLPGVYVFMDATTWHWIEPIPHKGFQGYRYVSEHPLPGVGPELRSMHGQFIGNLKVLGGWRDPRPPVPVAETVERNTP